MQAADALKYIADLLEFEAELGRIIQVLVLASAALSKIPAERFYPVWRRLHHAQEFCPCKVLFDFRDLGFNQFADRHPGDKEDKIIPPRHPLAAEGDVAYHQSQFVAHGWTHGPVTVGNWRIGQKKFFQAKCRDLRQWYSKAVASRSLSWAGTIQLKPGSQVLRATQALSFFWLFH
jgi:hypothetical protein